ncbi:MAG TPA: TetR family transcriptional regulator [Anaerolineales bacterium]|nr:TetR family transcriptional regulator [Anaerolineales bacterium]
MPKRTQEEAAQTRQDLLDAALSVFSRKGYHATRLEDIAEAASVTRGAIYHHFGSKADLYTALVNDVSAQFGLITQQAIEQGGDFYQVGTRVMVNTWTYLEENPRTRDITELFYYKTGDVPELAEIARKRKEDAVSTVEMVAGFIQACIGLGELPPTLDPTNGARAFIAFQNGIANLWLANRAAFSLKDNAAALAKIFMDGLMAQ